MNETSLRHQIGKVPNLTQALRLVLEKSTRYGRAVKSQSVELEASQSQANQRIKEAELERLRKKQLDKTRQRIDENEKQLEKTKAEEKPTARLEDRLLQLEHQREILTAMTHFGGRQIQASELAAALALVHGLHQKDLREPLNAARQLTRTSTRPIYSGMINTTYLLKGNLLYEMEKYLDTEQPFHVDGKNLAARFKVKDTHISYATGLLDLLEAVKKMPHDSAGTASHSSYRWIHAKHPTPEPTWCKHYNLLKAIVKNWVENNKPTAPKDVSRPHPYLSARLTGAVGQFANPGFVLDKLLTKQLIRLHSKKESATYYEPTPETIDDVTQTMDTGILPDRLRIRLLGEYDPYPAHVSQKQLQRLLRETEIILRTEKKPGIKGTELARGLGISDTHAAAIQMTSSAT